MKAITFPRNLPENCEHDSTGQRLKDEQGIAMLFVLIALSVLTMFSAYLFMSSVEELKVSDNSESMLQARFAARAGIEHAREALRGLQFNAVLKGPDGTYTNTSDYLNTVRSASFRNPATWSTFRSLNLADPTGDFGSLPDDGVVNTGSGTVLIPQTGIVFSATNPYGAGTLNTARYFVKVADNNGEASELAKDAANNPFVDGDGIIIVRSSGVAQTISDIAGGTIRRNSVAIFESRFMQGGGPFGPMGSPAIVIGSSIDANFSGNAFDITGTSEGPGLATIDTDLNDAFFPDQILKAATNGKGNITGNCTGADASNCIADITNSVINDTKKSQLRDPNWLHDFVFNQVPNMADNVITNGSIGSVDLGTTSNPKITFVSGDLSATGGITGAGLLVVTGSLAMGGSVNFDGLVLVIGSGDFWAHGMNRGIHGGLIVANLTEVNGAWTFGTSTVFDIRGNSQISSYDGSLASMGSGIIPLKQISFREIPSGMDP